MAQLGRPDWMAARTTRAVIAALEAALPGGSRFVGGCVRNTLMQRPVDDIDIATRLTPEAAVHALEAAGIRVIPTGIDHGTVTAVSDGQAFEITTLRRDVETDGRRAVIAYTEDWTLDAQRRDFRLNALYAEPDGCVHDPVGGGIEDAHAGRVIFIGDADQRLREDYLRILRFFRFNAWYGAGIDPEGLEACARQRAGLRRIAAERIWKEFRRLLAAPDPCRSVEAMHAAGVLDELLPRHDGSGGVERLASLVRIEDELSEAPDPMRRLMALTGRQASAVDAFVAHARLSNAEARRLEDWMKPASTLDLAAPAPALRAARFERGEAGFIDSAILEAAEDNGGVARLRAALSIGRDWPVPALPVSGDDIKALGLSGPAIGDMIRRLEQDWVASDFSLDREALIDLARRWMR